MRDKFYQHSDEQPYHISVGAVLYNDSNNICVHHFVRDAVPQNMQYLMNGVTDLYLLMRESIENGETIDEAVARGVQEEFGARGVIEKYIGSTEHRAKTRDGDYWKTTLYHSVRLIGMGERPKDNAEVFSIIEWIEPPKLMEIMKEQGRKTAFSDFDESKIIERFLQTYEIE